MTETKMTAAMRAAADKYKEEMDRFYVLLGLCSTDAEVDDCFAMEKQIESDFLTAYWEETKAINSRDDCMACNPRKVYRLVTGVTYAPAE